MTGLKPSLNLFGDFLEISCGSGSKAIAGGYCAEGFWLPDFAFARRLVISRAQSMNNFATGPKVRSFKVTIATGLGSIARSTGRTLSGEGKSPKCNSEAGTTERYRPVASRRLRK